ncbi:MAG: hypothetical protein ACLTSZ_06130 [Lachnospiraceae bacterium]
MATVIAQWVLAVLMIWKMTCLDEQYQLRISGLCGGTAELAEIVSTGLRSGMQAIFMSISSLLIQYSINSFGADAAAGMVVFSRVEGFCTIRLFPMVWHLPDLSVRTTVHTAWIA